MVAEVDSLDVRLHVPKAVEEVAKEKTVGAAGIPAGAAGVHCERRVPR